MTIDQPSEAHDVQHLMISMPLERLIQRVMTYASPTVYMS